MGGITLNYKAKKFTFFSGININNDGYLHTNLKQRSVTFNGVTTSLNEHSNQHERGVMANIFVGLDWFVNDKNTIGIRVEDIPGSTHSIRGGENNISDNSLGYNQLDFRASVPNTWNYIYTNFNAEHLFDSLGTKIKFNGDFYGPYNDVYPGTFQNNFYTNGSVAAPSVNFNNTNTIHVKTILMRLDFEKKLSKTFSLETGAKSSFDNMNSIYKLQNLDNTTGQYITDTTYTNTFTYKDQILAAYVNLQKQLNKFSLQGGLRAENTNLQTLSITSGIAHKRSYFNLFPTASISYNKNDKHTFQVSFNRRIDRPDYMNYNPYRQFLGNLLSYSIGNPFLYPSYTNNYEFSHNYKGMVGGSFSYSRTTNYMYGFPLQNDSTKQSVFKTTNLNRAETYALSMFAQKDITKWYTLSLNITGYYFGFTGNVNGTNYKKFAPSAYGYISNMFNLPAKFKLDISALYLSPWLNAVATSKTQWAVNFAIKKSFFNDKLNFSIGINDLFFTYVIGLLLMYLINTTM